MTYPLFSKKMLFFSFRKAFDDIVSREKPQLTCFTQVLYTLPVVTQENMCQAAIEISIRKFRIQLDGSVIINNCRTIVFQDRKHITSIIISIDKIRSQLNHLVQIAR